MSSTLFPKRIKIRGGRKVSAAKKCRKAVELRLQLLLQLKNAEKKYEESTVSVKPQEEEWERRMKLKEMAQRERMMLKRKLYRYDEDILNFGNKYKSSTKEERYQAMEVLLMRWKVRCIQEDVEKLAKCVVELSEDEEIKTIMKEMCVDDMISPIDSGDDDEDIIQIDLTEEEEMIVEF